MPRPFSSRRISGQPVATVFKPAGIPTFLLDEVVMTLDEFEALRLACLDGLYQARAAKQMHVSRPTFARIIESARHKVADALVHGKALRIEGGAVQQQAGPRRCCRAHDAPASPPPKAAARRTSTAARKRGA
ncbi:MAG: DUF134 domain-containing protein [Gemmatimonadaceae bacterium]|nr:DUF134 domain-containing protein [Gemmatimonadaceae bacterium]